MSKEYTLKNCTIELNIEPDGMIASIRLIPAPDVPPEQIPLSASDLEAFLDTKNVIFGVDEAVLARIVSERIFNEWIPVATGTPAIPGMDGTITFLFTADDNRRVKEDSSGKINLRELNLIHNVVKNDSLCEIMSATRGTPGINVHGKAVLTKDGKPARIPKGENVVLSEDGSRLLAAIEGMVVWDGMNVNVHPVYMVDMVDASIGNIHFNGTVVVNGEVGDGYEIHAGQDIIIAMSVGPIILEAQGNIKIKGGILGSQKGHITAGGNVEMKFIQDAQVSAGGSIIIDEYIRGSEVNAAGPVVVRNSHGGIAGSTVSSETWIYTHSVGTEHAPVPVRLIVGHDPSLPRKKKELEDGIYSTVKDFLKLYSSLIKLRNLKQKYELSKEHESLYSKILSAMLNLRSHLVSTDDEILRIGNKILKVYGGFIYIEGIANEGALIQIGTASQQIDRIKVAVQYSLSNGTLVEEPYTVKSEIKSFLSKGNYD